MGYIVNHTIVVEGYGTDKVAGDENILFLAHKKAKKIFKGICRVSPITKPIVNGSSSFFVAPDGSKEGWAHSTRADEARQEFKQFLKRTTLSWVEVMFGGDYNRADVVDDGDRE